jgi:ribose-phosphate pyrophosphokinase
MMHGDLAVFALDASREFGAAVAHAIGVGLEAHEEREFEDGEHKARPLTSVRDRDVYVVQSLHADPRQSGNDKLVRLLLFLGALKDASAARVTAVVPYLAYARKDRKSKSRDPVSTRYVAQMFEAIGTDCVVTLDVHNLAAFQNAFRCRSENLEANPLFVGHFASRLAGTDVVVVSPDAGGIKRAEDFRLRLAKVLGRPVSMAFAEKHRSSGVVSGEALVGDVAGRFAIIVDDLISGGTTVARAAQACRARGARQVHVAASHGLFAAAAGATLVQAPIDDIVVTDTVSAARVTDPDLLRRVTWLSAAPRFAEAIARLHRGGSLVELGES